MKRSPSSASSQEGAPSPSGQSHRERKCTWKRKGRKKHEDDSLHDPAITTDEVYDRIIVLAATLMCFGSNVSKDRNPLHPLKELLGCTGLGTLLVIILLLLKSGDVERNPGPVERRGWLCVVYSYAGLGVLTNSSVGRVSSY